MLQIVYPLTVYQFGFSCVISFCGSFLFFFFLSKLRIVTELILMHSDAILHC